MVMSGALLLLAAQAAAPAQVPAPAPPAPTTTPSPSVATSAKPIVDPSSWVTPDDYPTSALEAGEEGSVRVKFTVATSGLVSDCSVIRSSGSAALDQASCRAVQLRARFDPARDDHGQPIAITMSRSFNWRIPEPEPLAIMEHHARTHFTLADGRIVGCEQIIESVADKGLDGCQKFNSAGLFAALFGTAIKRTSAINIDVGMQPGASIARPEPAGTTRVSVAEAFVVIGADHRIVTCTSRIADALAESGLDLCDDVRNDSSTYSGSQTSFTYTIDATARFAAVR